MTEKPIRVTDINDKIKRLQRLIAEMHSKNDDEDGIGLHPL